MQVTSWNCRGLGNPLKVDAVKYLMKMVPSEILLLQETNIEEEVLLLISKNKWKLTAGKAINARGSCGGLATLWSAKKFQLKIWIVTQHWIFSELFHLSSKISYALFNLYVPVNYSEKKECWRTISEFLESNYPINIIIARDLNITLAPNEKKGGRYGKDLMQDTVQELIQVQDLIDLKPKIGCFTWSNQRVGIASISTRLDRFLLHSMLMDGKTIISLKIIPKLTSDHHPISLQFEKEEELGPIPFKFSPLWIERSRFMDIVSQAWSNYVLGSPNFFFEQKLKNTKLVLKQWVKSPLSTPTTRRMENVAELFSIQIGMEDRETTSSQKSQEQFAQYKTTQSFKQEEEHLRLKSRSLWLKAGDKNIAFFHCQCRVRLP